MKIGICDDFELLVKKLSEIVTELVADWEEPVEVFGYTSGEDLLQQLDQLDAVFLDIEMPGLDGIETGNQIHEQKPECVIIMATGCRERINDTFRIGASRFIVKPYEREDVEEALEMIQRKWIGFQEMEWYQNRNLYSIRQRDILYLRAMQGDVEAITKNGIYRRRANLKEMEQLLDSVLFYPIRRGYVVNLLHIGGYKKGHVEIADQKIKVPRAAQKEFEKRYMEFDIRYRS